MAAAADLGEDIPDRRGPFPTRSLCWLALNACGSSPSVMSDRSPAPRAPGDRVLHRRADIGIVGRGADPPNYLRDEPVELGRAPRRSVRARLPTPEQGVGHVVGVTIPGVPLE